MNKSNLKQQQKGDGRTNGRMKIENPGVGRNPLGSSNYSKSKTLIIQNKLSLKLLRGGQMAPHLRTQNSKHSI